MPASVSNGITAKSHKRRTVPGDVVDAEEAADMLGISPRTVRNYISSGMLRATRDIKTHKNMVSLDDLGSLASTLVSGMDFAAVARASVRALVSASRAEKRLEALESILGIEGVMLGTDEESVLSIYNQCRDIQAEYTEDYPATEVMEWSYLLAAVVEEYLEAVRLYTGDEEPWKVFMDAAEKLYSSAPKESFYYRKDLEVAYSYLATVRKQLRQVAYFHIRQKYGAAVASKAFPETSVNSRDEKIMRVVCMINSRSEVKRSPGPAACTPVPPTTDPESALRAVGQ
jgi:hypothetical protein